MKIYFVRNMTDKCYLHILHGYIVTWVSKDAATIYNTRGKADNAGKFAFHYEDDAEERFEIVEIDIDAALEVLRDLFEVRNLGDCIYDIREREGKDWEGPQVIQWGNAVTRAKKLLELKD